MAQLHRLLRILECFTLERPVIAPELLMEHLGISRASVFRDLRHLVEAGMVERLDDRGYALGPRVVQMDRQIRLADPMLQAAGDLPRQLAKEAGGGVLLCRLHNDTVLCILEVSPPTGQFTVSYERGRAMPLYRGATSKVILAHLSARRLDALVEKHRDELMAAGLPPNGTELHAAMEHVRRSGHLVTSAEVDPLVEGMAVPLMSGKRLLGSLSVVLSSRGHSALRVARTLQMLKRTARRIEARLEAAGRTNEKRQLI